VTGYAAVILAGGAGRRLGGPVKPTLPVGGRPMLDRVLAAVADARPRVVVGPASLAVPAGVVRISEEPPGGGPVAALAAGLAALAPAKTVAALTEAKTGTAAGLGGVAPDTVAALGGADPETVAVLAADLPFLTTDAVAALRRELLAESTVDGAVYVDAGGRRQTLCGVWRLGALRERLTALPRHHGTALRELLAGLRVREVAAPEHTPAPWYDCDTPEDLDRAEGWA
jgi:molybdopterin-guanine dinucleotide biosynthesis protein A